MEAADLGTTPTQNIEDLLSCLCSLFFVTNRYSAFPSWQATGTFEHHGCPCTSGEGYNDNNCAKNPNDNNQLDNDGGEDTARARGEAMARQDLGVSSSRGTGGAMGGDAATTRGKQEGGATRGSAKVARGNLADAKRRRSGAQHNNQPTTEQAMAKIAMGR